MDKPGVRLTLIASDPRISAALMILSVTKMILIYLNYRFWSVKLRDIYAEVLDTLVFDMNLDIFDMYRLFLFLWMFEFLLESSFKNLHRGRPFYLESVFIDAEISQVWWIFPLVVVSMLLHAEFGRNDHREDAPHCIKRAPMMSMFIEGLSFLSKICISI